jgi:hypothetical protein
MKARSALFALALLVISPQAYAATPEAAGPQPDVILRDLYKAHDAESGPFFERTNRAVLTRYFTDELAELIMKDAKESDGEVGAIAFDPLYESQDPQIEDFKIGAVQLGGNAKPKGAEPEDRVAVVKVTFKDGDERRTIAFRFQQAPDKSWKIADITYSDGSTLAGLTRDTSAEGGSSD